MKNPLPIDPMFEPELKTLLGELSTMTKVKMKLTASRYGLGSVAGLPTESIREHLMYNLPVAFTSNPLERARRHLLIINHQQLSGHATVDIDAETFRALCAIAGVK